MSSNASGLLIASGILDGMEGALGHSAWRWYAALLTHIQDDGSNLDRLFYIEGALTMFPVLVAAFVLPGFPPTSHR
jgi:hypothetical protein